MSEKIGGWLFQALLAVGVAVVFFTVGHYAPSFGKTTEVTTTTSTTADTRPTTTTASVTTPDTVTTTAALTTTAAGFVTEPSTTALTTVTTTTTFPKTVTTTTTTAKVTTTLPPAKPGSVPINTATKEQLMTIEGIGDVFAERIIEYREANGGFKSLEELQNIKGVGDKRYALWSLYFTLS